MPLITVLGSSGPAISYRFGSERIRIGRAPESDLALHDPSASRRHAEIAKDGEGWFVRDLRSQNGTRLNGRPVLSTARLQPGDRIELGESGTTLVFDAEVEGALSEGAARETLHETRSERGAGRDDRAPVLVGEAPALLRLLEELDAVADSPAPVLLTGETGTGKELLARLLHERSERADGPFVVVNCPAIPKELFESEVFGVEGGVATGVTARSGLLEHADGGTVMLDEIGDLDPTVQAKILRFLQEGSVRRVGAREERRLDLRVVAATHHDLGEAVQAGRFRADLYHRLDVIHLHLPALRERGNDVGLLARHFLEAEDGNLELSSAALAVLERHDWPGNVRELESVLTRAALLARGAGLDRIETGHLPQRLLESETDDTWQRLLEEPGSFWSLVREPFLARELSKEEAADLVERARREGGGTYKGAAACLGIAEEYKRFVNFVRHHGLGRSEDDDES